MGAVTSGRACECYPARISATFDRAGGAQAALLVGHVTTSKLPPRALPDRLRRGLFVRVDSGGTLACAAVTPPDDAQPSDEVLLDAARAGDRAAVERLLERFQRPILRFGIKLCGNPEDAREILQETLLAAARGLPDFRGEAALSTWLYSIARSFCIKRHRQRRFAPAHIESLEADAGRLADRVADPGPQPDDAVAAHELARQLDDAIGALEPMYREVLLLRDVEGLTAPEVAAVVGVGVDAVKSRLHRARAMMRERLAPVFGSDEGAPADSCPDIVELFSRDVEGEITSDLCAKMESHLAGCARCTRRCDGMRRVLAMCTSAPLPTVPTEVQEALRRALREQRHTL